MTDKKKPDQEKALVKKEPEEGVLALNLENIRKYICPSVASIQEAEEFLNICQINKLNPFLREAYFIKYKADSPAAFVVGFEVYLKRAQRTGRLKGWKAWTEACVLPVSGEKSMKACIEIFRSDWDKPFYHEVYWEEYAQYKKDFNTKQKVLTKFWNEKPQTMLKKVVMGQGFRLCFPEDISDLPYTEEERLERPELVEHEVITITPVAEPPKTDKPKEEKAPKEPKATRKKKAEPEPKPEPEKAEEAQPAKIDPPPAPPVPPEALAPEPEPEPKQPDLLEQAEEAAETAEEETTGDKADNLAMSNAIEQKLDLLAKEYGRNKGNIVEKLHNILKGEFRIQGSFTIPGDLSTEQLKYVLDILDATIKEETKKRELGG